MPASAVFIPLAGGDEELEIPVDELPGSGELLEILSSEKAPLKAWLRVACAYYHRGDTQAFESILNEATTTATSSASPSDRILIINAQAGHFAQMGLAEKRPEVKKKREDLLEKSIQLYNNAGRIAAQEGMDVDAGTWVGRGVICLIQGDDDRAGENFDNALQTTDDYIPAMLGKARIFFSGGKYDNALNLLCRCIELKPDCPANVRQGIGLCYFRKGKLELARKAFQRVLQLDKTNVDALMGLALMTLNDKSLDTDQAIMKAMSYTKAAATHDRDKQSAMVLNHLANHFFYTMDYKQTESNAVQAFHSTESESMKAESCYSIARRYHVNKEYAQAAQFYQEAVKRSSDGKYSEFVLPYFGLGQLCMWKKEFDDAIKHFETVLKSSPENFETLKVLGWLYAKQGGSVDSGEWTTYTKKAVEKLAKAVELRPDDPEARIELAQLLELNRDESTKALEHYRIASLVLERRGEAVRPEIHGNMAVLQHRLQKFDESEKSLVTALEFGEDAESESVSMIGKILAAGGGGDADNAAAAEDGEGGLSHEHITCAYNLARVFETRSCWTRATCIYEAILKECPEYTDAWLRLGVMARDIGHIEKAKEFFTKAQRHHGEKPNVDAATLMGSMHLKKNRLKDAQQVFEDIIQKMDNRDVYAHVALGNIYYTVAADAAKHTHNGEDAKEKENKYQNYALRNYRNAFELAKNSSIFASNGIGLVLADQGFHDEAKMIFQRVREATQELPDAWINLAHSYLAEKEYFQAITLYQNCQRKFYNGTKATLVMYTARAYFDWGKSLDKEASALTGAKESDTRQDSIAKFGQCRVQLEKALHLTPANYTIWFDIALAQLAQGVVAISSKVKVPSVPAVNTAMASLAAASKTFAFLRDSAKSESELGFKKAKAGAHVNSCEGKLSLAKDKLGEAQQGEAKAVIEAEKRAELLKNLKAQRAEKEAVAEAKRAEEKAKKAADQVKLQERRERVLENLARATKESHEEKPKSGKRKKNEEVDAIVEDEEEEEVKLGSEEPEGPPPTVEDLFGSDSDDDDVELGGDKANDPLAAAAAAVAEKTKEAAAKKRGPPKDKKPKKEKTAKEDSDDDELDLDDSDDDLVLEDDDAESKPAEAKKAKVAAAAVAAADDDDDDLDLDDGDSAPPAEATEDAPPAKAVEDAPAAASETPAADSSEGGGGGDASAADDAEQGGGTDRKRKADDDEAVAASADGAADGAAAGEAAAAPESKRSKRAVLDSDSDEDG